MTSVLGYARTFFVGGIYKPEPLATIQAEIDRFHEILQKVGELLDSDAHLQGISEYQLLLHLHCFAHASPVVPDKVNQITIPSVPSELRTG